MSKAKNKESSRPVKKTGFGLGGLPKDESYNKEEHPDDFVCLECKLDFCDEESPECEWFKRTQLGEDGLTVDQRYYRKKVGKLKYKVVGKK